MRIHWIRNPRPGYTDTEYKALLTPQLMHKYVEYVLMTSCMVMNIIITNEYWIMAKPLQFYHIFSTMRGQ